MAEAPNPTAKENVLYLLAELERAVEQAVHLLPQPDRQNAQTRLERIVASLKIKKNRMH
jgi:hypothetical protein